MGNDTCKCLKSHDLEKEVLVCAVPVTADASKDAEDVRYMRVVLRVQRHWRVVTARKRFANQAAVSYTGSTANKQTFLLHWQAKYIIANNLPANDSHWDSDDPGWVGKASMSKRHRFLIRRNLHWRWFNALIFGMLDDNQMVYPERHCCPDALSEIRMMKEAALTWVKGVREVEGWSENVGLFFHVYGHNSVNSLHMHVVDLDFVGPSFHCQEFKNLSVDHVIQVLEEDVGRGHCQVSALSSFPAIDDSMDLKVASVKECPVINSVETYRRARKNFWTLGGPRALRDQLERQGFLKDGSAKLTTSNKPFNVFARLAYQDSVGRTLFASENSLSKLQLKEKP